MPHPLSCDVLPSRPEWSLEHWHLHKAVHCQLSVSPHGNSLGPHRWKTHSCHECFGHHRKSAKVLQNPSVPVPCLKSVQPCLGAHCLINRTWFEPTNDGRNVCIALCNFYTMRPLCAAQSAAYIAKWFGASPGLWPLAWYQQPASTTLGYCNRAALPQPEYLLQKFRPQGYCCLSQPSGLQDVPKSPATAPRSDSFAPHRQSEKPRLEQILKTYSHVFCILLLATVWALPKLK